MLPFSRGTIISSLCCLSSVSFHNPQKHCFCLDSSIPSSFHLSFTRDTLCTASLITMDKLLTSYDREFPSLSNNPQLGNAGQSSMWATGGRNLGAPISRDQGTPIGSQPTQQQDDLFSASSRLSSAQGSFRFGNAPSATQGSQSQATSVDEFPPLARNANGDIGQERGANLMSSFGFGSTVAPSAVTAPLVRAGNGLLNALATNSRTTEIISATSGKLSQYLQHN